MDFELVRRQLARVELTTRDQVIRFAAEAREQGRKREAISWESRLRKLNKQIEQYGIERYSEHS